MGGFTESIDQHTIDALLKLVSQSGKVIALTGAGCSTASGIPDYRDLNGHWKNDQPMQYADFMESDKNRQRYWKRSLAGWRRFFEASPNPAHHAFVELEDKRVVTHLVTQNVDGLHQKAGHKNVIDLHGRLDNIVCTSCGTKTSRKEYQNLMLAANPEYQDWLKNETWSSAAQAPDGDVRLPDTALNLNVIDCDRCAGVLKPDVVFFGESVPRDVVDNVFRRIDLADLLLVAGSSLMVFSGFRFCRYAAECGKPIVIIAYGKTRGDALATMKIRADCGEVLETLANRSEGS